MPLDLLVTGRVATLAGDAGFGWVEAVGVKDGRIAFAGSAVELESRADPHTRRIELGPGEIALPGLTDAHLHLADAAIAARELDLTSAPTLEDGLAAVAAVHRGLADPDAWLLGHGWDSDRWGAWPTAASLAAAAPGRLVALWAHDHHSLWVSDVALAAAGVTTHEGDPDGGIIRRGPDGRPSGVLHEKAARLVSSIMPPADAGAVAAALPDLQRALLALGVVAVHDPAGLGSDPGLERSHVAYRDLDERGDLIVRLHACLREESLEVAAERGLRSGAALSGADEPRLRLGWLKLFADGTLGSRTAALLEPLEPETDRPIPPGQERGVWFTPPEVLAERAGRAAGLGIASQIHAIGDAAVRAALDALEPTVPRVPLMPRLEHVQLHAASDRPRFAAAGIAASIQPVHLRSDAATARRTWGERAEANGYAWRSLADAGAVLAFGTDAPVEPIDPWPGIAMAVLRRAPSWPPGVPAYGPAEALSLATALRGACLGPAITTREADRGRLVPGCRADLIVLPAAAGEVGEDAAAAFTSVRPRLTIVGGESVYEA